MPAHPANFVCALMPEARPVIDAFKLKKQPEHTSFSVFANSDNVQLIVSGIGPVASAGAVAYLHGIDHSRKNVIWVNVGIAGHASLPLGTVRLAHRIDSTMNRQRWFPPICFRSDLQSESLLTFTEPQSCYPPGTMIDMEGSGFYAMASRFSTVEVVHCLKIISDNNDHPGEQVNARKATDLVSSRLPNIVELFEQLQLLVDKLPDSSHGSTRSQLTTDCHFTVSQQHQLDNLLKRWQVLGADESIITDLLQHSTSKQRIRYFSAVLERLAMERSSL